MNDQEHNHGLVEMVETTPQLDRVVSHLSEYSQKSAYNKHHNTSANPLPGRRNTIQSSYQQNLNTIQSQPTTPMENMHLENGDSLFPETFPEGGKKAWSVVFGSFLGLTAVFGLVNGVGAIQAYVENNQLKDLPSSQVGWIFSVSLFLMFFISIQVGPIFDAWGPYQLIMAGICIHIPCLMLTSLCTEFYQFLLTFGIGCGIGLSLMFTPFVAVVGHWFNLNRGAATGAATVGGSVGGVIFPLMLRNLYDKVGFPWAIRILAFISLACCVVGMLLIKPRLEKKKLVLNPKEMIDLKALKDMRFLHLAIATVLVEVSLLTGMTYITSYCIASGMSESTSYLMLTLVNTAGVPGRYVAGVMADRIGRFNTFILSAALASVAIFGIWLPVGHVYGAMIAFALIYGFSTGTVMSVTPVCCGQICRVEDYGKRYGTLYFLASFGVLVGIPVFGLLIKGDNYDGLVAMCGVLYALTTLFLILSRHAAVGFKLCKV